ncbi:MAG: alpha/beta hydrolase, partial [Chitinophagaceae bacterium]|nr:alpha/beta hydrolase [Chitinophagaceae bacterium]
MPVLPTPSFQPPFWMLNGHWETIWPSLFRRVKFQYSTRERLELADGDFVDLDWKLSPRPTKDL